MTVAADPGELRRARELLSATAIRALAEDRWQRWRPWLDAPLFAAFVIGLAVVLTPASDGERPIPPLNSIASETVRAARAVAVEDKVATQARQQDAAEASPVVFDYDADRYARQAAGFADAVRDMAARRGADGTTPAQRRAQFQEQLGRPVTASTFDMLEKLDSPTDLSAAAATLFGLGAGHMVVADRGDLPGEGQIAVHDAAHDRIDKALVAGILELGQLRRLIQLRAGDLPQADSKLLRNFLVDTVSGLVAPNLVRNDALTQKLADEARAGTEPVMTRIEQGEAIVREGDKITATVQERLRLLNEGQAGRSTLGEVIATGFLALGLLMLAGGYFFDRRKRTFLGRKQVYMILAAFGLTQIVCLAAFYAGQGVAVGVGVPVDAAAFLAPVALGTLLVAFLVDVRAGLLVGIALAILTTYRVDGDLWVLTHYMAGVMAAGIAARRCRRRSDLLIAGLLIATAQLALVPIMAALDTTLPAAVLSYFVAVAVYGLIAAAITPALVTITLPLAEWAFHETTDMRLLELASADSALLKELALRSPGTYYHSMMMANLAEAAAEAIGANALQCRVMALYHDLGKMERPSCFVENQNGGNIHDRLPPELSARIIFAHIKDGIDIARKHRLGRPILDAITQHQGTTLLRIFYQKAQDRAARTGETVSEEEFRYPGPRPLTRESGILMLADSVEAATRALKDPRPEDVRARVAKIIRDKIEDHQLDDSPLTVRDLAVIEAEFQRVLTLGVFHVRIDYPPAAPRAAAPPSATETPHDPLRTAAAHPAIR